MASLLKTDKISTTAGGAQEFTLPAADGSSGQVVKTNASGVLSLGDLAVGQITSTGTASATTFLRGDGAWAATSGDNALSHVSQWNLTGELAGDAAPIATMLAEVERDWLCQSC